MPVRQAGSFVRPFGSLSSLLPLVLLCYVDLSLLVPLSACSFSPGQVVPGFFSPLFSGPGLFSQVFSGPCFLFACACCARLLGLRF